jgi:arginyl-tRNA synthetase
MHLFDVYVNINRDAEFDPGVKAAAAAWFKRMEDGDEDALKNWRVWRELSVKKYAEEYERLNVHFDVYTGESKVGKKWQDSALERLDEMGLISDIDGAKLVDLEKWKLGKAVLRKKGTFVPSVVSLVSHACLNNSDGTSIYLTRDIGGAIERYEQHKFDKMLYVISSQQDLHTAQFIKMLNLMEFPWASTIEHVNYGLVLGMSTRRGTVVFLKQIIHEAASGMHEQMKKNQEKYAAVEDPEQTSLEVGLAAIKIQDMAAKRCATTSLSLSYY